MFSTTLGDIEMPENPEPVCGGAVASPIRRGQHRHRRAQHTTAGWLALMGAPAPADAPVVGSPSGVGHDAVQLESFDQGRSELRETTAATF